MSKRVVRFIVLAAALGCLVGADWRQFRGSDNTSVAVNRQPPIAWNEHVAWKVDLPGRGPSSPIVVADRVYVTAASGANQDRLHVIGFSTGDGRKLWERQVWATGRTFCHGTSGVAAPTPASDGERVYAFYSSNDLVCFDLDGNLKWLRGLGHDYPKAGNDVGMSSSPLVVGDTVVVQVENQGDSFAAGLDTATGQTRWQLERERQANWASPAVLRGETPDRDVVLLQSPSGMTVHDPRTGRQLWEHKADCSTIPSPVTAGDVVYVPSGGITALRAPGVSGSSEILWQENRLGPSGASPLVHRERVYAVNSSGVLICGRIDDGDIVWRLRLKGRFWATPVAVGERLYLVNADGLVQVVRTGEQGELVGTSELGETIQCSPAVVDGAVFIRSDRHLWKIAEK